MTTPELAILDVLARAIGLPPLATAVAHPCDEPSLAAVLAARDRGLVVPILVGPEGKIRSLAAAAGLDDAGDPAGRERDIVAALGRLDTIWSELFPAEQQRILHLLVERIVIKPSGFAITLRAEGMRGLADELKPAGLGVAA